MRGVSVYRHKSLRSHLGPLVDQLQKLDRIVAGYRIDTALRLLTAMQ